MRQNSEFVLREIYGKNILMPIRYNEASNDPVFLNEVAALIWKLTATANDEEDLLKQICNEYDLKSDSAEAIAVEGFINQLIECKLISVE